MPRLCRTCDGTKKRVIAGEMGRGIAAKPSAVPCSIAPGRLMVNSTMAHGAICALLVISAWSSMQSCNRHTNSVRVARSARSHRQSWCDTSTYVTDMSARSSAGGKQDWRQREHVQRLVVALSVRGRDHGDVLLAASAHVRDRTRRDVVVETNGPESLAVPRLEGAAAPVACGADEHQSTGSHRDVG
jgi:hypothetical protein